MSDNYRLVKRIPAGGLKADGTPSNVKGVAVGVATNSIYTTTLEALQRIDLASEKIVWEKKIRRRITFSLDGTHAYPSTDEVIDVETRKNYAKMNGAKSPKKNSSCESWFLMERGPLQSFTTQ